jgi:3-hydroxyisobutyrate dehydrogenase-like beta-hydroxyacid dehydrogenase
MASGETIGLIGVGLLGTALAERFLQCGFDVLGFDIDESRRTALTGLGGRAAGSAAEVATTCRRIVLSLPTSAVSRDVIEEVLPRFGARTLLIDTTTGDPDEMELLAGAVERVGGTYLDATVGGSSAQVRDGQATVMVGGDRQAFERCRDLWNAFAREAFYVGPSGSGARMKLVVNLVLGLNRAVLAEGLALAKTMSLDLPTTLSILQAGPAFSRAMETKGAKMIEEDFTPQARLSQHLKDVRLILAAGAGSGAKLPLSAVHRQLLEQAEAAGYGDADNSAVIKVF